MFSVQELFRGQHYGKYNAVCYFMKFQFHLRVLQSRKKPASYYSHSEHCIHQESIRSYFCIPLLSRTPIPQHTHTCIHRDTRIHTCSLKKSDAYTVVNDAYIYCI